MGNVIDLKSRLDRKLREELKRVQEKVERNSVLLGASINLNPNNFHYEVDNSLIIDGWDPCGSTPLDENYFAERKEKLSKIGFPEIREERSEYKDTCEPCMVIYGRHK